MELWCDTTVVQLWCEVTVVSIVVRCRCYKICAMTGVAIGLGEQNDFLLGRVVGGKGGMREAMREALRCARHMECEKSRLSNH